MGLYFYYERTTFIDRRRVLDSKQAGRLELACRLFMWSVCEEPKVECRGLTWPSVVILPYLNAVSRNLVQIIIKITGPPVIIQTPVQTRKYSSGEGCSLLLLVTELVVIRSRPDFGITKVCAIQITLRRESHFADRVIRRSFSDFVATGSTRRPQ